VRITRDAHAIVFHDAELDRLADAIRSSRPPLLHRLAKVTLRGTAETIPSCLTC
jgi:hypothetical protein